MNPQPLKNIIEAALLAADHPLGIDLLLTLFFDGEQPSREEIRAALDELRNDCAQRGIELKEVSSGYRFQVKQELAPWVSRLWEERPARYSRALLETLALIVYRQPITRAEIEDIRGVAVSTNIIKTLQEREWIRVVAHREVPGRPALYGTTRQFLDAFDLKSLNDLPPLADIRDLEELPTPVSFGEEQASESGEPIIASVTDAVAEAANDTPADVQEQQEQKVDDAHQEEISSPG
ncbi:MAG: SMC-Scp complex subunit ScpB [Gammaproteobacteria bacterium]|nr:SMC-Scp complex subunit ScpB [Gammaproteobacteria bacterium]